MFPCSQVEVQDAKEAVFCREDVTHRRSSRELGTGHVAWPWCRHSANDTFACSIACRRPSFRPQGPPNYNAGKSMAEGSQNGRAQDTHELHSKLPLPPYLSPRPCFKMAGSRINMNYKANYEVWAYFFKVTCRCSRSLVDSKQRGNVGCGIHHVPDAITHALERIRHVHSSKEKCF